LEGRAVHVIFDVGANVGQTTTKYKKMFPKAQIYGFEPFRRAFEKYANHFRGDKRISGVNVALSNKNGKANFFVNDNHPTNSLLPIDKMGPMNNYKTILQVEVPTETIDSFCERKKIQNIGILKIDVQGGELLVLEGAKKMLVKGAIDLIYAEVEFVALYENQPLFEDIEKFLKQYDYKFYKNYNLYNDKNNNPATGDAIFLSPKIALEMQT